MSEFDGCRLVVGLDFAEVTSLLVGVGISKKAVQGLLDGQAVGGGGTTIANQGITILIVGEKGLGGDLKADGVDEMLMRLVKELSRRLIEMRKKENEKN